VSRKVQSSFGLFTGVIVYSTAFGGCLRWSSLSPIAAAVLRRRLAARHGGWNAAFIAAGTYLVAVIVVAPILPGINEVPDTFSAIVLWQFRIAGFGMQLMWATIGLVFGALTERALENRHQ
jgi:hypothetical protein